MPNPQNIKVGDKLVIRDSRFPEKVKLVVLIEGGFAYLEGKPKTKIRLDRVKPFDWSGKNGVLRFSRG